MAQVDLFGQAVEQNVLLRDKFIEPPFSVLDTRGGKWQARKRRWQALGMKSEVGRDGNLTYSGNAAKFDFYRVKEGEKEESQEQGTSIFDPALTELCYNWFAPPGGKILDPFAGGSVRGVVANYLGYRYTGIELREEQVLSNREQALEILPVDKQPQWYCGDSDDVLGRLSHPSKKTATTPIQYAEDRKIWVKREDFYNIHGANGAKARTAYHLIKRAKDAGYAGVTTAGSRKSPQINIVAQISKRLGLPFVAHCPEGELSAELVDAKNNGATIIQHRAGYNSVIIARAREYAAANKFCEIPFGMMCDEAITQTSKQVQDIPPDVKRIVIPVGSGMNLSGLLQGIRKSGDDIPVLGVVVGADPVKTLDAFAPIGWRTMCELVYSELDYHDEVKDNLLGDVQLDPVYEAKCLPYLKEGDLLWVVGIRKTLLPAGTPENAYIDPELEPSQNNAYDMIFSCPPYADLEVYSDLPEDLSNMTYDKFLPKYASIIRKSLALLKPGGFAVFVVGEVRGPDGFYYDFVGDTKKAFIASGAALYNDAILLNVVGSASMRASKAFEASKKLTKIHQNVLVFKKK